MQEQQHQEGSHSDKCLQKEILNKQLNVTQATRKEKEQTKASIRRKKIEIRENINEIETRKIIEKINETKRFFKYD